MFWIDIVIGTLAAFAVGVSSLFIESWPRQQQKIVLSEAELRRLCTELKLQRRILLFWFTFSGFWIFLVAPDVDWTYFGRWTGLFICLGLLGIYAIFGLVYRWMQRRKTTPEDPSPRPSNS
jgi:hypothetical protein